MHVRPATPDDALAISRVRVDTWRIAYDGLVPAEILESLDAEQEATSRRARIQLSDESGRRDLVAVEGDEVIGFAATGASPEDDTLGELFALYVLQSHWDTGAGHALLEAAESALEAAGLGNAVLWVLEGNERAAQFYEAHGWHEDGGVKTDDQFGGPTGWVAVERRRIKRLGQSAVANTTRSASASSTANPTRG